MKLFPIIYMINQSRSASRKSLIIAYLISSIVVLPADYVKSADLDNLKDLTLQCLNYQREQDCRYALVKLEGIQRLAASNSNYSCQTYALGLSSDLLMSQLKLNRGQSALLMLEKVASLCN